LVGDAYVPLGVLRNGYYSISINNGPVVNGVTLVLVVVAATPFNVSFVNVFRAVTTALFDTTVTDGSSTASIDLKLLLAIALLQLAGTKPILLMVSHNDR
jgi:hypothetical protein